MNHHPTILSKNLMPSSSMNLKDCEPKVIFAHIQAEKPRKVPQKLGFSSKSNPPLDPTQPNRFQSLVETK